VAAACFAVIGGLYGIVLAFVLVSSWERFEQARSRAEAEADALSDLYRHGAAPSAPTNDVLRGLTITYARSVVDEEVADHGRRQAGQQDGAALHRPVERGAHAGGRREAAGGVPEHAQQDGRLRRRAATGCCTRASGCLDRLIFLISSGW
jgi:hypothetical protein